MAEEVEQKSFIDTEPEEELDELLFIEVLEEVYEFVLHEHGLLL